MRLKQRDIAYILILVIVVALVVIPVATTGNITFDEWWASLFEPQTASIEPASTQEVPCSSAYSIYSSCEKGVCSSGYECLLKYAETGGASCTCSPAGLPPQVETPPHLACSNGAGYPVCNGDCPFGKTCAAYTEGSSKGCECVPCNTVTDISCTDTDGYLPLPAEPSATNGKDQYDVAGTVSATKQDCNLKVKTYTYKDECWSYGTLIYEYACQQNSNVLLSKKCSGCDAGACYVLACEDGTPFETCVKNNPPKYCNTEGKIVNFCTICGCLSDDYTCHWKTYDYPYGDGSCKLNCANGLKSGDCVPNNKPKLCDDGKLIDSCTLCGCPSDNLVCSSFGASLAFDTCGVSCSDGTKHGECKIGRANDDPSECVNGKFVDDCNRCPCMLIKRDANDEPINILTCTEDLTCKSKCLSSSGEFIDHNKCDSSNKPKYCNDGTWVNNCQECKCPDDKPVCNSDGTCSSAKSCGSTLHGYCSGWKRCYDGVLVPDCRTCPGGCPKPYTYCYSDGTCGF